MRLATTIAALAGLIALAALGACGKTAEQKQQEEMATLTSLGEKYVREKVLEPNQARFRNQFIGKGGAPCGEVNAKDAFGGYIGFQRYISVARDLTLLAQDVSPAEFEAQWQQLCR
ncbi:hypothetical protein GTP58_24310 [Duganella sp. CY15W]|uniref:hypothetical protein n=1 Tax=Duganella sp. CY15W TaxID=2692172 RepID=UPI00136C3D45|nr:hypothetical protein [Duganella sp. CY15W]MYM31462.1 hypothetical protein [Duganella sp. CY15W]